MDPKPAWSPAGLLEFVRTIDTSTLPALVETDAGRAVLKHPANPQGPTTLANEWIARALAEGFGMRTFDAAIFPYDGEPRLPLGPKDAPPAPCYLTRFAKGVAWTGDAAELDDLDDGRDVTRLVLLDTWLRNRDRFFPGRLASQSNLANVFLANSVAGPGKRTLVAMDFSHAFTRTGEWTVGLRSPAAVEDAGVYGLFPAFRPRWDEGVLAEARDLWNALDRARVERIIGSVPKAWIPDPETPAALADCLVARAAHLARIEPDEWRRRIGGQR